MAKTNAINTDDNDPSTRDTLDAEQQPAFVARKQLCHDLGYLLARFWLANRNHCQHANPNHREND